MYDSHATQISAAIWEDAEALRRAMVFVILSIRQPITLVPAMLEDVEEKDISSEHLWGHKRDAFEWTMANYKRLHGLIKNADSAEDVIWEIMEAPGLGIVKSAFVAQLAGFDVACLDSQNIKRLGLRWDRYRTRGGKSKRSPAMRARVAEYVRETNGKAREMWNDWCKFVAPIHKRTPSEISALHLAIIE